MGALTACSDPVSLLALPAGATAGALRVYDTLRGGGAEVMCEIPAHKSALVGGGSLARRGVRLAGAGGWEGDGSARIRTVDQAPFLFRWRRVGTQVVPFRHVSALAPVPGVEAARRACLRLLVGLGTSPRTSSKPNHLVARLPARPQGLLSWSPDGALLASASQKGTVVRVHAMPSASTTHTLRRGTTPATICAM